MDDDAKFWGDGVKVEIIPGKHRMVMTVREAGEILIVDWAEHSRGRAHKAARKACLKALEGTIEPEKAREAFIAAAEESGHAVLRK